jgi:hypothetical protein
MLSSIVSASANVIDEQNRLQFGSFHPLETVRPLLA